MNLTLRLAILASPFRSQIKLAAHILMGEGRLSKIVNGWVDPTDRERDAIADALGKHAGELFRSERAQGGRCA